jgi:hypothetical protein
MSKNKRGKNKPKSLKPMLLLNAISAPEIRISRGEIAIDVAEVQVGADRKRDRNTIGHVQRVQDWIQRLWKQGALNDRQWKAGKSFARDAETSTLGVRSQLGKDGGCGEPKDRMLGSMGPATSAERRINRALSALSKRHGGIVLWVAARGLAPHDWAAEHGLSPPEGLRILRVALLKLATHYGIDK